MRDSSDISSKCSRYGVSALGFWTRPLDRMRRRQGGGGGCRVAAVKAVVTIGGITAGGRLVVRPLYRRISALRNSDVFAATTLLMVLGTSVLTQAAGLSLALGAFLVGPPRAAPPPALLRSRSLPAPRPLSHSTAPSSACAAPVSPLHLITSGCAHAFVRPTPRGDRGGGGGQPARKSLPPHTTSWKGLAVCVRAKGLRGSWQGVHTETTRRQHHEIVL